MSENNHQREDIFSKSVRAGKRTYFFDVKSTRSNDYYLTITESKRRMGDDGSPIYEKHKIFLYREDFEKFLDGFNESVGKINELAASLPSTPPEIRESSSDERDEKPSSGFSDVSFDDLK
jgi:hypothetical protein